MSSSQVAKHTVEQRQGRFFIMIQRESVWVTWFQLCAEKIEEFTMTKKKIYGKRRDNCILKSKGKCLGLTPEDEHFQIPQGFKAANDRR